MSPPLETYLNDHLTGSVAALDLAGKAAKQNAGNRFGVFLSELAKAIDEDQAALEDVMQRLGVEKGGVKATAGRAAERLSRLRLHEKVTGDPDLSRLLELETLIMGVNGKLSLWESLRASVASAPALAGVDLDALVRRADDQLAALHDHHREAAALTFGPDRGDAGG